MNQHHDTSRSSADQLKRTVIVHYHLFKNAGTSIDQALEDQLAGDALKHIEGDLPWSTLPGDKALAYALDNPEVQAISSHQLRLPLPKHPAITFLPILFLRHPIDRFGSVYEFERCQDPASASPSVRIAQEGNLAGFAEWVVSREATAVCRNFQVLHLAGEQEDMRYARATPDHYRWAVDYLKSLPLFGLVEKFNASLEGFNRLLQAHASQVVLTSHVANVSSGRAVTLEERLSRIERELGGSLYRELLEHNALDLLLYEKAQKLFTQKLQSIAPQPGEPSRARRRYGMLRSFFTRAN